MRLGLARIVEAFQITLNEKTVVPIKLDPGNLGNLDLKR
jgi:hypothetical protein